MTKAKAKQVEGDFTVTPLYADCIRVDLLGEIMVKKTGVPTPGWGSARLTVEQAKALTVALTNAIAAASPRKRPVGA